MKDTISVADALSSITDATANLEELRCEYEEWQGNLPDSLQSSSLADKLGEIAYMSIEEFDTSEIESTLAEHHMLEDRLTEWKPSKYEKGGSRPKRWAAACGMGDYYAHALVEHIQERIDLLGDHEVDTDDLREALDLIETAINTFDECSGADLPLGFGRD